MTLDSKPIVNGKPSIGGMLVSFILFFAALLLSIFIIRQFTRNVMVAYDVNGNVIGGGEVVTKFVKPKFLQSAQSGTVQQTASSNSNQNQN